MKDVLLEAIDYLESKNPNTEDFLASVATTEVTMPETGKGIKKYVVNLYKPIIRSQQQMRLIAFRLIRNFPNRFNQQMLMPFLDYYDMEKECLKDFKKILYSSKGLSGENLPKYTSCLVFINTIGFIHSENQGRLTKAVNINNAINRGFDVQINDEIMSPVDTQLVKKIGTAFKNEVNRR
jgi:hypothetical protein